MGIVLDTNNGLLSKKNKLIIGFKVLIMNNGTNNNKLYQHDYYFGIKLYDIRDRLATRVSEFKICYI